MNKFVKKVIESDNEYFWSMGFISGPQYLEVKQWLEGNEDHGAPRRVSQWLRQDAEYIKQVHLEAAGYVWFVFPLVLLACKLYCNVLLKYAKRFE